jgi:hypothetical protein
MKKFILILSGIILSMTSYTQEDTYGLIVGLEVTAFDQAKVATEYLPSLFPDKVIQLNYLQSRLLNPNFFARSSDA